MADAVQVDRRPPVFEITIDRPPANAIDAATSRAMGTAFEQFRDDSALRAAIITGGGDRFFSAGWDLKSAAAGEAADADYGPGGFGGFPGLPGLTKPVIAAVNGMAVGGGFELVLAADLVVAAEGAEFWLPEAALGLVPDTGSMRLPRLLPGPLAKEMLLTGRRVTTAELAGWGLVNSIVSRDEVLAAARSLAAKIAAAAPLAIEAILAVIRRTSHESLDDAARLLRSGAIAEYQTAISSDDAKEGAAAFAEKRKPDWSGR